MDAVSSPLYHARRVVRLCSIVRVRKVQVGP